MLERAEFAERYDLAIMSSKGMGTTSVRKLVEELYTEVSILVLHDFDKSGFSIVGTLTRDTPRFQFKSPPRVIDLGLRLADVKQWGLQAEAVSYDSDPSENLKQNGVTAAEIQVLRGKPSGERFIGQRVELNAFTSEQLIEWLELKLAEHNIAKVVPDAQTLAKAYCIGST